TLGTSVAGVFGGYTVNALIGLEAVACFLRASAFILMRSLDQIFAQGSIVFVVAHPHLHQQRCLIHLQEIVIVLHPMPLYSPDLASVTSCL
ncbi:hypothetical protein Tco_0059434, partial [Tanacetum coccineum]